MHDDFDKYYILGGKGNEIRHTILNRTSSYVLSHYVSTCLEFAFGYFVRLYLIMILLVVISYCLISISILLLPQVSRFSCLLITRVESEEKNTKSSNCRYMWCLTIMTKMIKLIVIPIFSVAGPILNYNLSWSCSLLFLINADAKYQTGWNSLITMIIVR